VSLIDLTSAGTQDEIVLVLVVLPRLVALLLIPRFPVPGAAAGRVADMNACISPSFTAVRHGLARWSSRPHRARANQHTYPCVDTWVDCSLLRGKLRAKGRHARSGLA